MNQSAASPQVLIVDDDEGILLITADLLKKSGLHSITATSAEEALELLESNIVDLVVSDYQLPGMNGISFLNKVKARLPEAPRILFTGQEDSHIAEEATTRAGIFRFLRKPLNWDTFTTCVDEALLFKKSAEADRQYRETINSLVRAQNIELESSKALLEGLLSVLPFGVIALNQDGVVFKSNPAASGILGLEDSALIGKTPAEIGIPDKMSCGEHPIDWETPSGLKINLLWEKNELGDGRTVYSVVDVTKRTKLERMVFQGKKEIEAVFDSITDPIYLIDRSRKVIRANKAFADLVEKDFLSIVGASCSDLLAHLGPNCEACALNKSFLDGVPRQREWDDNRDRNFKTFLFPVLESGKVIGAVIRQQDMTADRQREKQYLQTEKMASIGQLAAGVAHEINNPVGFILSGLNRMGEYSDTLTRTRKETLRLQDMALQKGSYQDAWEAYSALTTANDLDYTLSDLNELVFECKDGAERIRKIVRDLKNFSHPDEGSAEMANINDCLESTLNIVWNELKYKCEIVREFGELPPILCHPGKLNQVFINLLVNAAHAIPERGTITIKTWFEPETAKIFIKITDTGVGIPPQILSRIFDPFFTTKPVGKGTGLGLHLSMNIVHGHQGELLVASTPGTGSAFTIILPVKSEGKE